MAIGSVGVEIVPDARGFPQKLRAKMASLDPKVDVKLDLDEAGFAARLRAAVARLDAAVNVRVDLDLAAARAALAQLSTNSPTVNIDVRVDRGAIRDVDRLATALTRLQAAGNDSTFRITLLGDERAIRDVTRLSNSLNRLQRQGNPLAIHIWVFIHGDREAIIRLGQLADAASRADQRISGGGRGGLLKALLALAPAVIPLGAAAAGAFGAAGAAAGVAALAFTGARREIELNTEIGKKFQRNANLIGQDIQRLQTIAAHGVFQQWMQETDRLHRTMPLLNQEVATLAPLLGDIAGRTTFGLFGGLKNFAPLINEMVGDVDKLAGKFEAWAIGPGGAKFAAALADEYHRVGPVLGDIGNTLGKVGGALKPIGDLEFDALGSVVRLIGDFADELHRFENTKGVKDLLEGIGDAIKVIEPAAAGAIHALGNLAESLGPIGSVLGFLVKGFGLAGSAMLDFGSAVGDAGALYVHALTDPKKIGSDLRHIGEDLHVVAKESATAIGVLGAVGPAIQAIQAKKTADQIVLLNDAADDLNPVLGVTRERAYAAAEALQKHRDSIAAAKVELAAFLHTSVNNVTALENGSAATSRYADALRTFAASGQTAADKAKLIGETLRAHQGDMLSFTGTLAAGYGAVYNMGDALKAERRHIEDLQDALKDPNLKGRALQRAQEDLADALANTESKAIDAKTGLIDYTKQGALPLTEQLQQIQDAATNAATATYQHELATKGASTAAADARQIFDTLSHDSLVNLGGQLGLDKTAAEKFADQYFKFAGKDFDVTLRQVGMSEINTTLNALGTLLADIFDKNWTTYLNAVDGVSGVIANIRSQLISLGNGVTVPIYTDPNQGVSHPGAGYSAAGGLIRGPGTKTSDSVPRWLSNGEYVIQAAAVDKYGPGFFDALNNGTKAPPAMPAYAAAASADAGADGGSDMSAIAAEIRKLGDRIERMQINIDGRAIDAAIGDRAFGYGRVG